MSITEQINYYQQKLTFEIDAADLHWARQQGKNLVVVDGRQHSYYQIEHIPGAVNLPHRELSFDTTTALDKSGTLHLLLRQYWLQWIDANGTQAVNAGI